VVGRRRSRPTPPAELHFELGDLRETLHRADITTTERRRANRISHDAKDDNLPRVDARLDEPRNVQPGLDPYMASIDKH
jgi:hypothetical protein